MSEILGSPLYMAPEIIERKRYNTKVDVWAAGVILHILLVGDPPFKGDSKKEVFSAIRK
jgi:serine/threonine-protein kinase ULK2